MRINMTCLLILFLPGKPWRRQGHVPLTHPSCHFIIESEVNLG